MFVFDNRWHQMPEVPLRIIVKFVEDMKKEDVKKLQKDDVKKFLEEHFVRKLLFSRPLPLDGDTVEQKPFCYDSAWKITDDVHIFRRCQTNGLNQTLMFFKKKGVIQLYEYEETSWFNYTKVSLTELESTDYMKQMCYPQLYKGTGLGNLIFSLVFNERCRRRVEITKSGERELSFKVNSREFYEK